jgi:hypothetical protein
VTVGAVSRRVQQLKFFRRVYKASYETKQVEQLLDAIRLRGMLRDSLKRASIRVTRVQQAHHIIPVEAVKQCRLMQLAVLGKFKLNGVPNGVPLSLKQHKRRHSELGDYNRYVLGELLRIEEELGPRISQKKAREAVEALVKTLEGHFS